MKKKMSRTRLPEPFNSMFLSMGRKFSLPLIFVFLTSGLNIFAGTIGTPNLYTPLSDVSSQRPLFQWSSVSNATQYRLNVQRWNGQDWVVHFEEVIPNVTQFQSSSSNTDLQLDASYRWTVRAETVSSFGSWATMVYFNYSILPQLAIPVLLNPTEDVDTSRPYFSWQSVDTANNYRLNVQRFNGSTWELYFETVTNQLSYQAPIGSTNELTPNSSYSWTVRAERNSPIEYGDWADGIVFHYPPILGELATPTSVEPLGDVISENPTFRWTSVENASNYRLNVQKWNGFSWVLHFEVVTIDPTTTFTPELQTHLLDSNTTFRWNVRAENGEVFSNWTNEIYFNFTEFSLNPPTPISPLSDTNDSTPNFQWSEISQADLYRLNVQKQADDASWNLFFEITTDQLSYQTLPVPEQELVEGTYFWTVRSETLDPVQVQSEWSDAVVFNFPIRELGIPNHFEPASGASVSTANPNFSWSAVEEATGYILKVQKLTGTWAPYFTVDSDDPNFLSFRAGATQADYLLQPGFLYRWTVHAKQGSTVGTGLPYTQFSYIPPQQLPSPIPVKPLRDVASSSSVFRWTPIEDADRYVFTIEKWNGAIWADFDSIYTIQSQCMPRSLEFGKKYRWSVVAEKGTQSSLTSQKIVFQYPPRLPLNKVKEGFLEVHAPHPVFPVQGEVNSAKPTFQWDMVPGAEEYVLTLEHRNEGTWELFFRKTILSGWTCSYPLGLDDSIVLSTGQEYRWKVRAKNSEEEGIDTDWNQFMCNIYANPQGDPVEIKADGTVFTQARPLLTLPSNADAYEYGSNEKTWTLKMYHQGEASIDIHIDFPSTRGVDGIIANFENGEVYSLSNGTVEYTLTRDKDLAIHSNIVAHGGKPYAPMGLSQNDINSLGDNTPALKQAIFNAENKTVFIPRGRWLMRSSMNTLNDGQNISGWSRNQTQLVSPLLIENPTSIPSNTLWGEALLTDPDKTDNITIKNLTISGIYRDPVFEIFPSTVVGETNSFESLGRGILIPGDSLTIEGVNFKYLNHCAYIHQGTNNVVKNNYMTMAHVGVVFNASQMVESPQEADIVEDSTVLGNTINIVGTQGIINSEDLIRDENGIDIKRFPNKRIRILDNRIVGAGHRGIHLGEVEGGLILGNEIYFGGGGANAAGILANGKDLIIMKNKIFNINSNSIASNPQWVQGAGIKLENGVMRTIVADNQVYSCETSAIGLTCFNESIAITKNRLEGSGQRGIRLQSGSYSVSGCAMIKPSPFPNVNDSDPELESMSSSISNIWIVDNNISDIYGYYPTNGWTPSPYPTNQTSEDCVPVGDGEGSKELLEPIIQLVFNVPFPSLRAESNVRIPGTSQIGHAVSLAQNPLFSQIFNLTAANSVIPQNNQNILIAADFTSYGTIMTDPFVENLFFLDLSGSSSPATPDIYAVDNLGIEIDDYSIVTATNGILSDYATHLTYAKNTIWISNFGNPDDGNSTQIETSSFDFLKVLIANPIGGEK